MEYPVKINNVRICDTTRKNYKYVVAREVHNDKDEIELWYYAFTNDLYDASMMCRETNNGVVLELENCI